MTTPLPQDPSTGAAPDPLVVFVGAGPGAADLITVRGVQALRHARAVLSDALCDPELRQWAPQAVWTEVGKRGFCASTPQEQINRLLVQTAQRMGVVVRLKGGDPSIFGRLEEEIAALNAAGIAWQVVPGVTAALAAAAQSGLPLTRRGRGRSVILATAATRDPHTGRATDHLTECAARGSTDGSGDGSANESPNDAANHGAETLVLYMAGRQLARLGSRLRNQGWPSDTPVSVVSRAGCSDALCSHHPLSEMATATLLHAGRPTVVTVGVGAAPVRTAGSSNSFTARSTSPNLQSAPSQGDESAFDAVAACNQTTSFSHDPRRS